MSAADAGLRRARITALVCSLIAVVYGMVSVDPSPAVVLLTSLAPVITVIMWLQTDAHRTGVGAVLDFGFFLWLAWPVLIPWYAWKTRGFAGWRLIVGLFALIVSAQVMWGLTAWVNQGLAAAGH